MKRIGFYGTGSYAHVHAKSLQRIGAEIAGCWGRTPENSRAFADEFGGEVFEDVERMISPDSIDVLYIVVPPCGHDGAAELRAIEQGIPFLCEKPVGLDLGLCRNISKKVENTGLVTSSGYQMRAAEVNVRVKAFLSEHAFSSVRSWRLANCPQKEWWLKMETSGGMMVEQATHAVDLMRYFFGDITDICALANAGITAGKYEQADIYDSMETLVRFGSGPIGSVGVTNVLHRSMSDAVMFKACGEEAVVEYGMDEVRFKQGDAEWEVLPVFTSERGDALNRNFLEAVDKQDPALVFGSYPDAVKTLDTTLRMNEAAGV